MCTTATVGIPFENYISPLNHIVILLNNCLMTDEWFFFGSCFVRFLRSPDYILYKKKFVLFYICGLFDSKWSVLLHNYTFKTIFLSHWLRCIEIDRNAFLFGFDVLVFLFLSLFSQLFCAFSSYNTMFHLTRYKYSI